MNPQPTQPVAPTQQPPVDLSTLTPQQLSQKVTQLTAMNRQSGISDEDTVSALKAKGIMIGQNGVVSYQTPGLAQAEAVQPTAVGSFIRGALRTVASPLMSLQNAGEVVSGVPETNQAPQNAFTKYLEAGNAGPIQRVGAGFDVTKGATPENLHAVSDSLKQGLNIGLLGAGGEGTADTLADTAAGRLKQAAIEGAKTGAIVGGLGGATSYEDPNQTVGGALLKTGEGALSGAALGAVTPVALDGLGGAKNLLTGASKDIGDATAASGTPEFNKSVMAAEKVNNPYNMRTAEDKDFLNGSNATTKGIPGLTEKAVLKPEVMAADPHNELQRELLDKGVTKVGAEPSKNIAAVENEASQEHMNNKNFLADPHNDVPVKYSELKKNIEAEFAKMKSDAVFTPGSAEERAAENIKDAYLKEIEKSYRNQPIENAGSASGVKTGIEAFNKKMEGALGKDIYAGTPEGKAKIIMSQLARKSGYDTIEDTLSTEENAKLQKNRFGKQAKPLLDRAKNFSSYDDFANAMKSEFSNSDAENKFYEKVGEQNPKSETSTATESGLNLNDRNTLSGGTHGTGYSTTPDEDLREIWDMAHSGVNSTKGAAWKASLQREAKLYALRDEMKFRTNPQAGTTAAQRFFASPKGFALRRIVRGLAGSAGGVAIGSAEFGSR